MSTNGGTGQGRRTPQAIAEAIVELHRRGLSLGEIARQLGISKTTAWRTIKPKTA